MRNDTKIETQYGNKTVNFCINVVYTCIHVHFEAMTPNKNLKLGNP